MDEFTTYEEIAAEAKVNPEFRKGLMVAAEVCRSNDHDPQRTCPAIIVAHYLDRLAEGKMP